MKRILMLFSILLILCGITFSWISYSINEDPFSNDFTHTHSNTEVPNQIEHSHIDTPVDIISSSNLTIKSTIFNCKSNCILNQPSSFINSYLNSIWQPPKNA